MPALSLGALGGLCGLTFLASWKLTSPAARPTARWVQTQRGIPNKPANISRETENPCNVCGGVGRTNCWTCNGRGRVNFLDEAVLPQGELPVWCSYCRGGLVYCDGCMGTGVKREPIGFRV
eukprot:jgi/Tetstr1/425180/TSEL_015641.t1